MAYVYGSAVICALALFLVGGRPVITDQPLSTNKLDSWLASRKEGLSEGQSLLALRRDAVFGSSTTEVLFDADGNKVEDPQVSSRSYVMFVL